MGAPGPTGQLLGSAPGGQPALVEAYLARSGMFATGVGDPRRYDEMTGTDGSLLPGWSELAAALNAIGEHGLADLSGRVDRMLEDDGVTYTPVDAVVADPAAAPADPERWRLDPLPLVVEDAEWRRLEAGLIQRSTLMDAVLADLYGDGKIIENGLLPPQLVYLHRDYLRPAHGITIPGAHQLFFHAVDVCRSTTGSFQALGDRTQAPSGAGYAMADRRVVSRVLPDLFRRSGPRGLGAFFHTMRSALASVGAGPGGGSAGRRADPGHAFGDRLRPGDAGLATGCPAGRKRRPDHPAGPVVDAVHGSRGAGGRGGAAGGRLLVRPA